jgi:hypothetical protein
MHLSAPAPEHLPPALAAKLQTLLAPPTAPRPVATDERYSPLRAEITKIDALTVLEDPPNWPRIAALSAAILADSGKDLLIAAYAALAFFKTNDLPGLTLGLHFFSELFLNNAPDLTPTRPKNRSIALSWYLDHLLRDPPRPPIRPEQAPLLRALPAQIRRLRALADDHLGEFTPSFSPLLKIIEALTAELPPEPDTAPTDTAPHRHNPCPNPRNCHAPRPRAAPRAPATRRGRHRPAHAARRAPSHRRPMARPDHP